MSAPAMADAAKLLGRPVGVHHNEERLYAALTRPRANTPVAWGDVPATAGSGRSPQGRGQLPAVGDHVVAGLAGGRHSVPLRYSFR